MTFMINCDSAEVLPLSHKSLEVRVDTGIKDMVDAVGPEDLLEQIGREAAIKYWDIEEVGEEA